MKIAAIILLGGRSERFSQTTLKQYTLLRDKPLFQHAYDTFVGSGLFSEVILVTREPLPDFSSVPAGETRQESVYNGLRALDPDTEYVMVHDGVRPFVSIEIIQRNIDAVEKYKAVNTCIATHDTINIAREGKIDSIPKRSSCMRGQTPQTFSYPLLLEAHEKGKGENAPDDCSLVLALGHPIKIVEGAEENFKITTALDLAFAEALIYNGKN